MKLLFPKLLLCCICVGGPGEGANLQDPRLQVPDWVLRQRSIEEFMRSHELSDPKVRSAVINAYNVETHDPNWGELAEGQQYEMYYQWLGELVQKAATDYHDASAWRSLVFSNYGEYSEFAGWLAKQPEALNFFFDMRHSQYVGLRGRALTMLAEALGSCEAQPTQTCAETLNKNQIIRSLIRTNLFSENRADAVEAEGFCGTQEDLKLLEKSVLQRHPIGIDMNNQMEVQSFHQNVARVELKIKQRLHKQ